MSCLYHETYEGHERNAENDLYFSLIATTHVPKIGCKKWRMDFPKNGHGNITNLPAPNPPVSYSPEVLDISLAKSSQRGVSQFFVSFVCFVVN